MTRSRCREQRQRRKRKRRGKYKQRFSPQEFSRSYDLKGQQKRRIQDAAIAKIHRNLSPNAPAAEAVYWFIKKTASHAPASQPNASAPTKRSSVSSRLRTRVALGCGQVLSFFDSLRSPPFKNDLPSWQIQGTGRGKPAVAHNCRIVRFARFPEHKSYRRS